MLKFPESIRNPSFPIDISYEDITLQSKKESGDTKIRRKYSEARITFNVTWNSLNVSEYQTLREFYINDCQTNVNEFIWDYPSVSDLNVVFSNSVFHKHSFVVRFDEFTAKANEYNQYTVSVVLKGSLHSKIQMKKSSAIATVIPIVYDDKITYLIDNTNIDGTLIWGPSTVNSDYIGFVNNYTDSKYFSSKNIVDADMNETNSEVYTAYVRNPDNTNIYSDTYQGKFSNEFKIQRNGDVFKSLSVDYLTNETRSAVFNTANSDFVPNMIRELPYLVSRDFNISSREFLYQWANFKVDKEGYFKLVSIPYCYRGGSFVYLKESGKFKILGKLEKTEESIRASSGGAIGRQYTKKKHVKSGYYREDVPNDYNNTKNGSYSYTVIFPTLLDDRLESLIYSEPYIVASFQDVLFTSYTSEEVPTDYTPIVYNYLRYIGGDPKPTYSNKRNDGVHKALAHSGCAKASISDQGYTPDSYYEGVYTVGQLTSSGSTIRHDGNYKCWYSVKCSFQYTLNQVPIKAKLNEGLTHIKSYNYFDIPVQNNYVVRFAVNKTIVKTGSFSFLGIYNNSGVFIVKPDINIRIIDNVSFLVLSNGEFLLGIHNKGLYRISKSGATQTLVSDKLYNFRLNYQQK